MKRIFSAIALVALAAIQVGAQESNQLLDAYQRNFATASLGTKLELLKEASANETANMAPLFENALKFVLDNVTFMSGDNKLREMAIYSCNAIRKYKTTTASQPLWLVFQTYKDYTVRVPALLALGDLAQNETKIIENLNTYLANQNTMFKSGIPADFPVLEALIYALGRLGDQSSFGQLFTAYNIGYNDVITARALEAMVSIKGDYKALLIDILKKASWNEKYAALVAGMENTKLTPEQKGEIAENALSIALVTSTPSAEDTVVQRNTRIRAVKELMSLKWSKASPLAVKNFQAVRLEFLKSLTPKSSLLEAVAFLGVMGTTEAAETLASYLELINTETEQTNSYDEQIALAVITNLGTLGDRVAFNHLLYVSFLKYSDGIKKAAREALAKIKL